MPLWVSVLPPDVITSPFTIAEFCSISIMVSVVTMGAPAVVVTVITSPYPVPLALVAYART